MPAPSPPPGHLDRGRRDGDGDEHDTAPSRASILPSMAAPSVAVVEHLRVAGLVARARRQEAAALLAALFGGCAFGLGQVVDLLERARAVRTFCA
jgi:hypothetical protein